MLMVLYILTCAATLILALMYQLTAPLRLLILNALLPPVGLLYTLYVVYVVRPHVIAQARGIQEPPPFFVPYLEKIRHTILRGWGYIMELLGRKPPKID